MDGAGGGSGADGGADPPLDAVEAEVLAAEFLMEDYAIFAYGAAAPALDADMKAVALLFRDHHVAHQDHAGETLIAAAGTRPRRRRRPTTSSCRAIRSPSCGWP
jgi:hypothetical protein